MEKQMRSSPDISPSGTLAEQKGGAWWSRRMAGEQRVAEQKYGAAMAEQRAALT